MSIENALFELRRLDELARQDTPLHRLDARAKVLATVFFLISLLSLNRYEVARLLPYAAFPWLLAVLGNIPLAVLFRRAALALPFVLMVGLFNPLLDRTVLVHFGPLAVTGGMLSFTSIVLRAILAVTTGLALVAVTGFDNICRALGRMGLPSVFLVQLQFLYRYIFVLAAEATRMMHARSLRCAKSSRPSLREYRSLLGCLLLRTLDRAGRVHQAMLCRGFDGSMPGYGHTTSFGAAEVRFCLVCGLYLVAVRIFDLPLLLGGLAGGLFR
ncbi:MAG: cobalt ECF transporter T component CbiQ [Humidesulfovibrio sp.]|uniref:cobalt ECF transporter T component CbiQ n=1 Tax=Humidesulfovibrio sp. TaxID=2910988 RepID=UPI002734FD55|nr:cobalt ECF transporter T component CbiQ [Humidesulfovibrio sp.]MDP2846559.1 cobalt ECF transporter T component CbiQ [Humidesulfovibrio sp.]